MTAFQRLLCIASLATYGLATASPTANEFLPCHRAAAQVLQRCLDQQAGAPGPQCWQNAQRANDRCYADVRQSHRPDPAKIAAQRKAAEAAGRD